MSPVLQPRFSPYNPVEIRPILQSRWNEKQLFAILIDPDKHPAQKVAQRAGLAQKCGVDFLLIGGTKITPRKTDLAVQAAKKSTSLPLVLFPGIDHPDETLVGAAHAFLCPWIPNPVTKFDFQTWYKLAALRSSCIMLPSIPISYVVIGKEANTTLHRQTGIVPLDPDMPQAIAHLAIEGEMRGQQMTYLEAGSGANQPVPTQVIKWVWSSTDNPIVVGGGIKKPAQAQERIEAGASIIVVGNALEKKFDPGLIREMAAATHA